MPTPTSPPRLTSPADCSAPARSHHPAGYAALLAWASTLGRVDRIGVEGTGSYGAGLVRWLRVHGQAVLEVDRPARAARWCQGLADTLDAHAAAPSGAGRHGQGDP
jgi:transposase